MAKTTLVTRYFRARLFERCNTQFRSVYVWDFGKFSMLNAFYNTVSGNEVKRDDCYIEFTLCSVGDFNETVLESINIPVNCPAILNYDHPRRAIKTGQIFNLGSDNRDT